MIEARDGDGVEDHLIGGLFQAVRRNRTIASAEALTNVIDSMRPALMAANPGWAKD